MEENEINEEDYIPEADELEEETNGAINIADEMESQANNKGLMRDVEDKEEHDSDFISLQQKGEGFNFPTTEIETGEWTSFKADVAEQVGRFGDQVFLGSPANETDNMELGRSGLQDIIEASEEKLAEKLNDNDQK
ncbi:hypothetical protein [Halanaerobaculum tunisiense]